MYVDDIKQFEKLEKELETDTKNKNIQPGYRNGICHKKCFLFILKSAKIKIKEGIELPNQERIGILGEKEN